MNAPARRTCVKVCGLTRAEDAAWAVECGADWLGFIVKGHSPRAVSAAQAGEIMAALTGVIGVAVMVSPSPADALALARAAGASRVQLHRVDPRDWPADFPLPCSFGLGVGEDGAFRGIVPPLPHLVLLDTAHDKLEGGTGRTFPWNAARELASDRHVMLAGGLDHTNVGDAIAAALPFGVDAASRLESSPGIKDHERVRRYIAAVRECDERIRTSA